MTEGACALCHARRVLASSPQRRKHSHMIIYRVQHSNGRFSHVSGRRAALAYARESTGAPANTKGSELAKHWGVVITEVSAEVARSVGFKNVTNKEAI